MRLSGQCEKEGCVLNAKWFIVEHGISWAWVACDEHEAEKKPTELSVAIPLPPPADP